MSKYLICILLLIVGFTAIEAKKPKKKEKSGELKENRFIDKQFKFEVEIPDGFKPELKDDEGCYRLSLIPQNHKIPDYLYSTPELALIPVIDIYVTEMNIDPVFYLDSLLSDDHQSAFKKNIMQDFVSSDEKFTFEWLRTMQKKPMLINGSKAIHWIGKISYKDGRFVNLASARQQLSTSTVGEAKRQIDFGAILIVIQNNNMLLFLRTKCEKQFTNEISEEVEKIANSIKW
ncbi:MAG: hypothetical protein ABIJ45_05905 [Candidatus Zixiibacteriota bacterium]